MGTPFRLPFVLGDEGDATYFLAQLADLRTHGIPALRVNHPFLMIYYLNAVTALFGTSDQLLRASMIVFALGTGIVVYETGRLVLRGALGALLAASAMFYLPVFSLFSQRVSHEPPTGFFVALALFFLLRAFLSPAERTRRELWAASAATLLGCLFNFSAYFLAPAWLLLLRNMPKEHRRFAFCLAAATFTTAAVLYFAFAIAARPHDLFAVMFDTGRQRMVFGATPDGYGRVSIPEWFWFAYIKRLGWLNPLALACAFTAAFLSKNRSTRFYLQCGLIVGHLNVFVFSSGALGWICYFYFLAFPLAIGLVSFFETVSHRLTAFQGRGLAAAWIVVFYCLSQPFVKKAFLTPGAGHLFPEWQPKLARLDKWLITKPDVQPFYERIKDAVAGSIGNAA